MELGVRIAVFLLLIAVPVAAPPQVAVQAPAAVPATTALARGVTYSHLTEKSPAGEPWSIHVLRVDRRERSIAIRAVNGSGPLGEMQRELPTALAQRAAHNGAQVHAVVNGDYDLAGEYLGISDGFSISSERLWTTGKAIWPAFAILGSGEPVIGGATATITFVSRRQRWPVGSVNKPESAAYGPASSALVYTREYRPLLRSKAPFAAVVVEKLSRRLPLPAEGTVRGVVREVISGATELTVPSDAFVVLKFGGGPAWDVKRGDKVELRIRVRVNGKKVREAIGGFPIIVKNGKPGVIGQTNDNLPRRHPRTAVCYNDREIIFTVVDGRQPQLSVGMTLVELADLMVRLGCKEAMNTDGGGSSVMAISSSVAGGAGFAAPSANSNSTGAASSAPTFRIVNSPSDGRERGRGNAWIIVKK